MTDNNAAENTDIEIWRKVEDDFCSPSIHVTKSGSIGMNVGSSVIVAPVEKWFKALQEEGKEKAYDLDIAIGRIVKEVLEKEGVINKVIDGIHKAAEKNGFDCFGKEREGKVKMKDTSCDTDKYHTKEGLYFNRLDNGDVEITLKNEKTNKVVLDCDTWASVVASVCVKEKEEKVKTDNDLYIDYKGYYECLPILIDFIKEEVRVDNKKAVNALKRWDDDRPD